MYVYTYIYIYIYVYTHTLVLLCSYFLVDFFCRFCRRPARKRTERIQYTVYGITRTGRIIITLYERTRGTYTNTRTPSMTHAPAREHAGNGHAHERVGHVNDVYLGMTYRCICYRTAASLYHVRTRTQHADVDAQAHDTI